MKVLITIISIFLALGVNAQTTPLDSTGRVDSVMDIYSTQPITVKMPVKGVILYAYYFSRNFSWANRNAPDGYKPIIGSGTKPDSVVTVTISAKNLADFVTNVISERYGAISATATSLFNNSPAIPGYTALFTQVVSIQNGVTSQKNAAEYVVWRYTAYTKVMTDLTAQYNAIGLDWIRN